MLMCTFIYSSEVLKTTCSREVTNLGPHQKVISYSFLNKIPGYSKGLNEIMKGVSIFYPGLESSYLFFLSRYFISQIIHEKLELLSIFVTLIEFLHRFSLSGIILFRYPSSRVKEKCPANCRPKTHQDWEYC
ncbi:hypothetical protein Avbf_13647 [Armadillidium vulgare]|nr:hypothetical protein Avbf_13647 [Armadillidium vulgare]